jgi:hypothetical protein
MPPKLTQQASGFLVSSDDIMGDAASMLANVSLGSQDSSPDFQPSSGAISQAMSPEKGPVAKTRKENLDEKAYI